MIGKVRLIRLCEADSKKPCKREAVMLGVSKRGNGDPFQKPLVELCARHARGRGWKDHRGNVPKQRKRP